MTSLNEAISGLEQKIASAYAALEENGVTVGVPKTLTNLPTVLAETAGFVRLKPISARVGKVYLTTTPALYVANTGSTLLVVYEIKKTDKNNFLIVYPNLGNRLRTGLGNEFSTSYYDIDASDAVEILGLVPFGHVHDNPSEHLYTVWQASNLSAEYKYLYVGLDNMGSEAPLEGFEIYQF